MTFSEEISVRSTKETEFIDITNQVAEKVANSGINKGILTIHTVHTTTGLFINESEGGILKDYERLLELIPKGAGYEHDRLGEGNAHAHLRAVLLGSSLTIPVVEGRPKLGSWQRVFLAELDGPRNRKVILQLVG